MGFLEIVILSIVQGITEFLPVSSSGHLVVCQALMREFKLGELADPVEVNIVLHVGTLLSVLAYYWRPIARLLTQDRRVILLLILGTIPAAAIGVPLEKFGDQLLTSPLLAGFMFLATGGLLVWSSRLQQKAAEATYTELSIGQTFLIGLFQAFALLPGVSRSGSTIVAGMSVGMRRDSAATFAFLLAIPAIGGAGFLKVLDAVSATEPSTTPWYVLLTGAAISFAIGLACLWWLSHWVRSGKLHLFAWWVIPLGVAVIGWQLFRMVR